MLRATEVIDRIAEHALENYARAFDAGDAALQAAGLTTPLRLGHFLAQVLYETGLATVLFENMVYTSPARIMQIFGVGNHSAAVREDELPGLVNNDRALAERVYGLGNPTKAAELGNTEPGDGYRYRGGGLLQTTGRANYRRIGEATCIAFEEHPELVVDPAYALAPALQEWTEGHLNDAADRNDITTITRVINGGYNGLDGRQALFNQIRPLLDGTATDDGTAWLQTALNRLGAAPPLQVDGRPGPATTDAIRQFQARAGLNADGIAGPATLAAIRSALPIS